jgi:hypothetical protein
MAEMDHHPSDASQNSAGVEVSPTHLPGVIPYIIFISFIMPPQPSHFIIISFMDIGPIFIS